MHDDPLLPVLASGPKLARGWPKYEVGARVTYAPLSELLTTRWAGDAHFCAYSVPRIERRLVTSPPAYERIGGGVPMLVLILDLDCAAAHKAQGGTEGVRADDAWWSVERARIARIQRAHPGGVWYRTRGGARGVYRLPRPLVVRAAADEIAWRKFYVGAAASLARRFGLVCDPSISDWPRVHRLPFVTRDGVAQNTELLGDPRAVGLWTYEPTSDEAALDLAAARSLGQYAQPWAAAARVLGADDEGARARARMPRAARVVEARPLAVGALAALALDLGRAIRGYSGRHGLHLALAGACYARGVPLTQGPELARAICAASGETDDRPQVWATTADRVRAGQAVQGYGRLREVWPFVADVVDAALPLDGGARAARDALDGLGVPPEVPATEAAPLVRAAIERANGGLSVVRTTEGAGKTRAAGSVAADRALSARPGPRTPSHERTLLVAESHAVARTWVEQLDAAGAYGEYWQSVLAVRDPDTGAPSCAYHVPLTALARGGQATQTVFCDGIGAGSKGADAPCPRRDLCPARAQAVVSFGRPRSADDTPKVIVTVHALLRAGLATVGDDALVVIDEDPEAISPHVLTREALERAGAASGFGTRELYRLVLARTLAAGLERGELVEPGPDTLRTVLARGCAALESDEGWREELSRAYGQVEPDADAMLLAFARAAGWRERRSDDGAVTMVRRGTWAPRLHPQTRALVFAQGRVRADLADASEVHATLARLVVGALGASATPDGATPHDERAIAVVERSEVDPSRRVLRALIASPAVAQAFRRPGPTVLLDATADPQVLEAIAGTRVPVTHVRVTDGAPVRRVLLYWSSASRRGCLDERGAPRWDRGLGRYLAAALREATAGGARRVALFTWRTLTEHVQAALGGEPGADAELVAMAEALRDQGAELVLGYYGATRGRDTWRDCDAYVSVGDPRPNLGTSRAVSAALGLTADADAVYRRATAAEASQAAGRARAPWRTTPTTWVHVGTVPPASWDARAEVLELPRGASEVVSAETVRALVHVYGSARLGGAAGGVSTRSAERSVSTKNPCVFEQSRTPPRNPISIEIGAAGGACDSAKVHGNSALFSRIANPSAAKVAEITGASRATAYHWLKGTRAVPPEAQALLLAAYAAEQAGHEEPTDDERAEMDSWLPAGSRTSGRATSAKGMRHDRGK